MSLSSRFRFVSVIQGLALAGLVTAATVLLFAAAPSMVLADSVTDQYTEPEVPKVQPDKNRPDNRGPNKDSGPNKDRPDTGSNRVDDSAKPISEGPSGAEPSSVEPNHVESRGSNPGKADGSVPDRSADSGTRPGGSPDGGVGDPDSDNKTEDEKSAAAALSGIGGGGGFGGGSGFSLIIGFILLLPLIAGGSYILWRQYGGGDDETRDLLRTALRGDKSGPPPGNG